MKISLFRDVFDKTPVVEDTTWSALVAELCLPPVTGTPKKQVPLYSPAEYLQDTPRADGNVIALHFVVLDFDHLSPAKDAAVRASLYGYEHVLVTSYSHDETEAAYRVVLPLTRPVPAEDWPAVWTGVTSRIGAGHADLACRNLSRFYHWPSCPPERAHLARSLHRIGRPIDPDDITIAASRPPTPPTGSMSITRAHVKTLVAQLKRRKQWRLGHSLAFVVNGEPFADPGGRDLLAYQLCGEIAEVFPDASPESVAKLFLPSLQAMAADHPHDPPKGDIADKFARQVEIKNDAAAIAQAALAKAAKDEATAQALRIRATIGRDTPYTPTELAQFATSERCTPEEFQHRWIIHKGASLWVFVAGTYRGPYQTAGVGPTLHALLSPAVSVGVELEKVGAQGVTYSRPAPDLLQYYGTPADHIEADLTQSRATYDAPRRTLIEAPAPLASLTPRYDPLIEEWLSLLGGPKADLLEQWLSYVTDLAVPCAALYLEGYPGTGKSLLAQGVARLWGRSPTSLDQAMGAFNADLSSNPLCFADEKAPTDYRGHSKTEELREFIQATSRPLRRKFQANATLKGAARVIFASNNGNLLAGEADLTQADIQAISDRMLHIQCTPGAASYLTHTDTSQWVDNDLIARHVLFLVQHRPATAHPPRFLVQDPDGIVAQGLAVHTNIGSAVCNWILEWLNDPVRLRSGKPSLDCAHHVHVHNGHIMVNVKTLLQYWGLYDTGYPRVSVRKLARALEAICEKGAVRPGTVLPGRPRFRVVKTEDIVRWAEDVRFDTREHITERIAALDVADRDNYYYGVSVGMN